MPAIDAFPRQLPALVIFSFLFARCSYTKPEMRDGFFFFFFFYTISLRSGIASGYIVNLFVDDDE